MKKFAIILSGCGVYDGVEIHEAIMLMLAVQKAGCSYQLFAPNVEQHHVVNHLTGEVTTEKRNVLVESARIARGNVKPLNEFNAREYDALLLPGGYGAAKNLSNYAFVGTDMVVYHEVEKVIKEMYTLRKPIGAVCIAPVLLAKLLPNVKITVGSPSSDSCNIESLSAEYEATTQHGKAVVDEKHKVVTAPCYMLTASLLDIANDAEAVVTEVLKLV